MDPVISEIQLFAFDFAPRGWASCNGQILSIAQNTALFSLLGTTYGGNGTTTFALPDLRGRAPIHFGNLTGGGNYTQGQQAGSAALALTTAQIPAHNHLMLASVNIANQPTPGGNLLARGASPALYSAGGSGASMAGTMLAPAGNSQPHENRQPYLVVNYCIALVGIYPSRN